MRFQFTLRRMMILVVVVALLLSVMQMFLLIKQDGDAKRADALWINPPYVGP